MNTAILSSSPQPGQRAVHTASGLISIIVPVLNEEPLITPFLQHLRRRAPEAEVIVADGGSGDATADLAEAFGVQVVKSVPNRAVQMNTAARVASGDILWFLHVDLTVPENCLQAIARCLTDPRTVGGFFRMRLPGRRLVYRLTDEFAHYAGRVMRMRCGDHGLFCRRDEFPAMGGFPEVTLMEDVAFFRRLRRRGHIAIVSSRILADDRRYRAIGPLRLTLAYGLIAILYFFHAPLPLLSRIYDRFCSRRA
jgi:rSAM/selenodomain-associated transferase 2